MAGIGDTKRAVLLAKEMLESSDKFVADDSADKEAKADAAEHRDNYATVLSKNGEFSQANINYRTSIAAFDS